MGEMERISITGLLPDGTRVSIAKFEGEGHQAEACLIAHQWLNEHWPEKWYYNGKKEPRDGKYVFSDRHTAHRMYQLSGHQTDMPLVFIVSDYEARMAWENVQAHTSDIWKLLQDAPAPPDASSTPARELVVWMSRYQAWHEKVAALVIELASPELTE